MPDYDLKIKNGNLFEAGDGLDIAIKDGRIAAIGKALPGEGTVEIDAAGSLVGPSFIDSHTHLDKAMSAIDLDADGLGDAIEQSIVFENSIPIEEAAENIKERGRIMLDWEYQNGSCAIKTHVRVDPIWGMEALHATNDLKEEYKGKLDLINITPYDPAYDASWRDAARNGEIDFIAGYPGLMGSDTYAEDTDLLFDLAMQYDLPLDLHVNEADAADLRCFEYVLKKTKETGLNERVTCGHVTGMNAVSDEQAAADIALAKELNINIITLPSCNMYLMGRNDHEPIRRGLTRVREFLEAGVNIAYASDNIRDHFRPFGNGDMLEEALFTAQCIQFGTVKQLNTIYRMGTYNAAKNCLRKDYGLSIGCLADLVIFKEPTAAQAIISQNPRRFVIKDGVIVAKKGEPAK